MSKQRVNVIVRSKGVAETATNLGVQRKKPSGNPGRAPLTLVFATSKILVEAFVNQ